MRYKVECPRCLCKFRVEGEEPRFCVKCGDGVFPVAELTRVELAKVPYEVPEGTPNIHEVKDAFDLNNLTRIGYTRSRKIWLAIHERKMVFEKPVDLLNVGGIGIPTVEKLIGKVGFGWPETAVPKGWVICPHCGKKTKIFQGRCLTCNGSVV